MKIQLIYKKEMKNIFVLSALLFAIFFAASLSAMPVKLTDIERQYIKEHPVIKVQAERYRAPFNFTVNGKATGYSNDIIKLVASNVGLKIEFIYDHSWDEYLDMLKKGDLDVISNIKRTSLRDEYVLFTSDKPQNFVNSLLTKNNAQHLANFKDFNGRKLAVLKGSFYQELMESTHPEINLLLTDNLNDSMEAFLAGKAIAILDSQASLSYLIHQKFVHHVVNTPLINDPVFSHIIINMGVSKNNGILRDILDKGLKSISKAELFYLQEKWLLSENKSSLNFSFEEKIPVFNEEENIYLLNKDTLRMCVNPNWLPMEGIANGKYVGMGSDFVRLFSLRLIPPIKLVETKSWDETIHFMKNGKCDFIPLITKNKSRTDYISFTKSYLSFPFVFVVNQRQYIHRLETTFSKPIGILKNNSYITLLKSNYPSIKLFEFETITDGLNAIDSGRIFAFIDTLPVVTKALQTSHPDLKIIDKLHLNDDKLSVGVPKSSPILHSIFNKVVNSISLKEKQEIVNAWIPITYKQITTPSWLYYFVVISIFILSILFVFIKKLKKLNEKLKLEQKNISEYAIRDQLTSLHNRFYFEEQLRIEWLRARRSKKVLSLLLLDLDNFKCYNEANGRKAGDQCLVEFSRQLMEVAKRPSDLIARFAGEEFAIILPNTDEKGLRVIAEKIQLFLRDWSLEHNNPPISDVLTVSIGGVSMYFNKTYKAYELIRRADNALFKAQQSGCDQFVMYGNKL